MQVFETNLDSKLLKWLIRMNRVYAVLLITVVTVIGSETLTVGLMLAFSAPKHWIVIGLAISTVVPMVLATTVIVFFLQMVHTLEKAREMVAKSAMTDMLTEIYNRRYFMLEAQNEFEKAQRYKLPLSIILFDVDRFKSLNDTYGHSAGDDVLRELSIVCGRCLRSSDVFARYGGEEFVVLLPLTTGASACELAERIRRGVEEMSVFCGDIPLPTTISLGVAERLSTMASIQEMLKEADLWLYEAKKNGRNRVEGGWSVL